VTFSVIALRAAGLQIVKRVVSAVHYCDYVVYGVGWVSAVVARWVALQDDCAVAFVFWVAVFFTHCYRAASGLLSFAVV